MKVSGQEPTRPADLSVHQAKAKEKVEGQSAAKAEKGQQTAAPQSGQSFTVNRVKEAIMAEPEVRADKVSELKAKIKSGEYQVDPQKLAKNMLTASLREDLD